MTQQQKSYFDNHPTVSELHFASDGMPFPEKHNAEAHANGLADREVTTVRRHDPVEENAAGSGQAEGGADESGAGGARQQDSQGATGESKKRNKRA